MKKPIVAVEMSHSGVKITVGYELDRQPVVLYAAFTQVYGAIVDGVIVDPDPLAEALLHLIQEAEANLRFKFDTIIFALPAIGLQVYQAERSSTVVSASSKIDQIDVSNVINIFRKEAVFENAQVVSIVPDLFSIDTGDRFLVPPLGYDSNTLTIAAKIQILPDQVCDSYTETLEKTSYKVHKTFVDAYGLCELYRDYQELPPNYLLIDLGAGKTTVSLVGQGSLFATTYIFNGGNKLDQHLVKRLGVPVEEALRLKENYGADDRDITFKVKIANGQTPDGKPQPIYLSTLRTAINEWLVDYISNIQLAINQLGKEQGNPDSVMTLPLVFTGGLIHLNGFDKKLTEIFPVRQLHIVPPLAFGARHGRYATCLGLIKAFTKYRDQIGDERARVTAVGREIKSRRIERDSDEQL